MEGKEFPPWAGEGSDTAPFSGPNSDIGLRGTEGIAASSQAFEISQEPNTGISIPWGTCFPLGNVSLSQLKWKPRKGPEVRHQELTPLCSAGNVGAVTVSLLHPPKTRDNTGREMARGEVWLLHPLELLGIP